MEMGMGMGRKVPGVPRRSGYRNDNIRFLLPIIDICHFLASRIGIPSERGCGTFPVLSMYVGMTRNFERRCVYTMCVHMAMQRQKRRAMAAYLPTYHTTIAPQPHLLPGALSTLPALAGN